MDDMFFTKDERSLRRGKRVAMRTETCRPCVIATGGDSPTEGVVLDANPFGMLVRTFESIPIGSAVVIQLMRDDRFEEPFSTPLRGEVVRLEEAANGFMDLGVRLERPKLEAPKKRTVYIRPRTVNRPRGRSRMHTLDITIGDEPGGRFSR